MDTYETCCKYNIAETCCASLSLTSLLALHPNPPSPLSLLQPSSFQNYGHIRGLPALLSHISSLYTPASSELPPLPTENILTTPGAIAANFLVFYALLGPGDHVICHYPTYQQLYSVPASLGAEVSLWKAEAGKGWVPGFEELEKLVRPGRTKMIIINNPNNPTGAALPEPLLQRIVDLAHKHSLILLSDEVYRPLFHSLPPQTPAPPSILSLIPTGTSQNAPYENTISTGSLSKSFSLAGIRVGWIATRSRELTEKFASARDYTAISVGQTDQLIASFALSPAVLPALLERNLALAKRNLAVLDAFVVKYKDVCEFVRPVAGTTAFLRFRTRGQGRPVDAVGFCEKVLEETGVLFLPGDRGFGGEFEGYVRVGYVPEDGVVREGFEALEGFMEKGFEGLVGSGGV